MCCMYVCMCRWVVCVYMCVYVGLVVYVYGMLNVRMCACNIHAYMIALVYVCVYGRMYVRMGGWMFSRMCEWLREICMCVWCLHNALCLCVICCIQLHTTAGRAFET